MNKHALLVYCVKSGGKRVKHEKTFVSDIKIAYIGGGSRGWAWTLMNDQ